MILKLFTILLVSITVLCSSNQAFSSAPNPKSSAHRSVSQTKVQKRKARKQQRRLKKRKKRLQRIHNFLHSKLGRKLVKRLPKKAKSDEEMPIKVWHVILLALAGLGYLIIDRGVVGALTAIGLGVLGILAAALFVLLWYGVFVRSISKYAR
ncbi:MAG TPA: hypothetical protein DCS93_00070 [Microscillaceae bacterium]|nr:hypothetical protein [Microscillaceae bacterium]